MKKPCLLIITLVIFLASFKASKLFAQNDKQNYILSVSSPLKIKRDTFIYKLMPNGYQPKQIKEDYAVIQVTFTNNSDDTLKYIGMSCSWWDIYKIDNSQMAILQPDDGCFKNGPTVIAIAPKTSSAVNLTILFPKQLSKATNFRIGMILQKYTKGHGLYLNKFQSNNTIWSNEAIVP